ncbi:4-hydroxy-tetrahydrodipicolinate synthase [Sphingomonas oleivorans]|uniref:4-hydroxy-tetrahydrodipicolinate synthase n=1 Tax=Sphingomonas oleivorans TaxID=1735121 RepID=A0A2T5FZC0_9SPHN|nr:4-hydroxy-tetrahydrodipicolinate synthase [Sphingomonas oleivorans]PTQ12046.1 4-hydroxy-tetrahydrodipicolinate synthase [Sphingomonas oleivorans]
MFRGSIPALVTPFRGETLDEEALRAHVEWLISEGSHALLACGSTGEHATLTPDELFRVIAISVDQAAGRVPVIAGCGSNSTRTAATHMNVAAELGANAALLVVPYYSRPNQEGIYAHFAACADACPLPIIIYNVPSRTVADVSVETLGRLAEIPTIIGLKDATGDLARVSAQRLACGTAFAQLSGNDGTALGFNAMGGIGCISVTANIAPRLCADFQEATLSGDWKKALEIEGRLHPLHAALFSDASPAPAKYALSRLRNFPPHLRLPMVPASDASRREVDAALEHAGLVRS